MEGETVEELSGRFFSAHCGSDVGLGLPQLLPKSLCQRSNRILGGAVKVLVCTGRHPVATHTARGR